MGKAYKAPSFPLLTLAFSLLVEGPGQRWLLSVGPAACRLFSLPCRRSPRKVEGRHLAKAYKAPSRPVLPGEANLMVGGEGHPGLFSATHAVTKCYNSEWPGEPPERRRPTIPILKDG